MGEAGRVRREDDRRVDATDDLAGERTAPARQLLDGVEDLLDEIDEVLEDNAEEFVRGYVQKGGE